MILDVPSSHLEKRKKKKNQEELGIKRRALNDKAVAVPLPLKTHATTRTYTHRLNTTELPLTVTFTSACWSRDIECLKHTKDN